MIALSRVLKYIVIIAALLLAYTFIEPYWLKTKTYTIASPEVPACFQKTKIVFLSDIHHGPFFSVKRLRKLVEKVNRLEPDIILLGGDYVHRDPKYIAPCFRELSRLKAPLGVYGVLGNHDHWEDLVFAGHTHGGQVTFFGLWAPLVPSQYGQKYRTGLISVGDIRVIVTNGIGTITPPVRFFARPQIIVAVLE